MLPFTLSLFDDAIDISSPLIDADIFAAFLDIIF